MTGTAKVSRAMDRKHAGRFWGSLCMQWAIFSCDSVHDAFYILTPNMMEHIMAMDRRAGGKVYLRFLREGKIHVAVNSRRDHFEVGSLNDADLPSLRMKFRGEVRYVTELIDALLTVDTLYKQ